MSDKYNGWTNYQSWVIALWLDNDRGSYDAARELAKEAFAESQSETLKDGSVLRTRKQVASARLASRLKDMVEEMTPEAVNGSVFADLIAHGIGVADWREIADHYLDDIDG